MPVKESSFAVNGYQLAARQWHEGAPLKIIACHGWLDNAASFDVLAPLLDNCHIVALDMPGHGLSDHKPPQATYNIWDDLLDILAVADAMGWQTVNLVGHSRGAIISMLLAAAMPERIASLVMLDAIFPEPVDAADTARQLHKFLTGQRSLHNKRLPDYPSIDEAVAARCRAANMTASSARLIAERGLSNRGGRFCWNSDPRLTTASAFKLTADHSRALLEAITMPNLLLLAEQGLGAIEQVRQSATAGGAIDCRLLPGSHHFHMEQQAPLIAATMQRFYAEQNLSTISGD